MLQIDADFHIHSPHSIGVSKDMTIPNIAAGARRKGVMLVGTGDATQPDWLNHLRTTLEPTDEGLKYEDVYFIITVEIEDEDAIHHVVLLPDFEAVEQLREFLRPHSPNLDHEWGGRPRANVNGGMLAGLVRDAGGLIGPAHAFTPYRSIFREGKYDSLAACYGQEVQHIHFIELGLSADTEIADHIPELRNRTFITSSDAHSPTPNKLGREFVRLEVEQPTYDEIAKALKREGGRGATLNVGLDPRLGKYYLSFCSSCRRTLILEEGDGPPSFDEMNVYFRVGSPEEQAELLSDIHERRIKCPACGKRLRLGVRDRAKMIGEVKSKSPPHRPPYLHMPPLTELIRVSLGVKSTTSKRVRSLYDQLISSVGTETYILTEADERPIANVNKRISEVILSYRSGEVGYIPGGGGRYGQVVAPWSEKT
ncbi:MAG: endonuclease Q family protein [Candidatus Thorarchaeota archaeon]|nr:endonuclease Q family protein [Candidatus Thorarchaeota archaeon]